MRILGEDLLLYTPILAIDASCWTFVETRHDVKVMDSYSLHCISFGRLMVCPYHLLISSIFPMMLPYFAEITNLPRKTIAAKKGEWDNVLSLFSQVLSAICCSLFSPPTSSFSVCHDVNEHRYISCTTSGALSMISSDFPQAMGQVGKVITPALGKMANKMKMWLHLFIARTRQQSAEMDGLGAVLQKMDIIADLPSCYYIP